MNKTKTLAQTLQTKTKEQVFGSNILDSATVDNLADYFYFRYECDSEDKFIFFLQRNMKFYKKQYTDMLRVQNTEFDPMITRYLERQVLNTVSNTNSGTIAGTEVGTKATVHGGNVTVNTTQTGRDNGTLTSQEDSQYSNSGSGTDSNTASGTDAKTNRARNINSVFPQANVSAATSGTLDDPISYRYATSMTDTQNKENGSNSSQSNGTYTDAENGTGRTTGSTTNTNERSMTGQQTTTNNDTENVNTSNNTSKTTTTSGSEDSNLRERLTGRENYDAGTLLTHAREYIANTNAFMWLVNQLEKCFIGNLRYGEED